MVSGFAEGLERASIGEAGSVVADLGQEPCAAEFARPGKAGDYLVVRVLLERVDSGLAELLGVVAFGVERRQQSESLTPQRFLGGAPRRNPRERHQEHSAAVLRAAICAGVAASMGGPYRDRMAMFNGLTGRARRVE